ncbi:sortase [Streptomyces sp. NPDC049585]|uniref:sortase domain-containing protein n=1 Tax=Streptomyces sp. NPDC049585 TaxID=3155154 RepID=UPI00342656A1
MFVSVSRRLSAPLLPLAGLLLALLAACAPGGGTDKAIGGPARADEPSRVVIPSLGVDSPLIRLGRDPGERVRVPPREKSGTAGWVLNSARPGTPGTAVIVGHDSPHDSSHDGGKPVFHDLHRLARNDVVDVVRGDGQVLHFTVTGTETVEGDTLPSAEPHGPAEEKALRLVTCGGDGGEGYEHRRLIVSATLQK